MQTISLPYQCNEDDRVSLDTLRETFSAAVRLAYCRAAVLDPKSGKWKVLQKKDVESAIRSKFSSGDASPRILRSAAYEAWSERKRVPDGSICWGGTSCRPPARRRSVTRGSPSGGEDGRGGAAEGFSDDRGRP